MNMSYVLRTKKHIIDNLPFMGFYHSILCYKMRFSGNRRARYFVEKYDGCLRLDLGSGSSAKEGYVGVDISSNADVRWDIRWGLPFFDNSVDTIRSDHFFEHLELMDVIRVLKECKRVLKRGSVLDFSVPHINPYLDSYLKNDFEFLKNKIYDIPEDQEELYNTCFDRISWLLNRSGEHRSIFDCDSIISKVKLAGFSDVIVRDFDPQIDHNLRYSSIYIRAKK